MQKEVISVRFRGRGKSYYFDASGYNVESGQAVIVSTSKGLEFGECVRGNFFTEETPAITPLRVVVRLANDTDRRKVEENKKREQEAHIVCLEKIRQHGLEMKLVDVEYSFDGSKILFFFTADGRVDFRELVRDLAATFRTRIELRQIGVRDEAKMLGGLGICGKQFCCSQFLGEFQPVSIKMAKTQGLSLNPGKISGACGRLMCCLKYEQDAYEELVKNAPRIDSYVETPEGKGIVTEVNLLRQKAKVRMEVGGDPVVTYFPLEDIQFIKTGKQRRAELAAAPPQAEPPPQPKAHRPLSKSLNPEKSPAPKAASKKVSSILKPSSVRRTKPKTADGDSPAKQTGDKPQKSSRNYRRRPKKSGNSSGSTEK